MPFKRLFKGLSKVFQRPLKGLLKAFQRPFKGSSKAVCLVLCKRQKTKKTQDDLLAPPLLGRQTKVRALRNSPHMLVSPQTCKLS